MTDQSVTCLLSDGRDNVLRLHRAILIQQCSVFHHSAIDLLEHVGVSTLKGDSKSLRELMSSTVEILFRTLIVDSIATNSLKEILCFLAPVPRVGHGQWKEDLS